MLHHSSDIDDPFSVLDLREFRGLLHMWITGICRASHWRSGNLALHSSRQHPRSCRCTGSVWASRSSARLTRTRLPFIATECPPLRSRIALRWSISVSLLDLLGGGHCLCTAGCRVSPRHELRLRHLVSFRDIWPLSLYHSVYDLNSLRDLLDGRHPFLYCRFTAPVSS